MAALRMLSTRAVAGLHCVRLPSSHSAMLYDRGRTMAIFMAPQASSYAHFALQARMLTTVCRATLLVTTTLLYCGRPQALMLREL